MDFTHLEKFIDSLVEQGKTPGADCIVCKEHKQIFRHNAGVNNMKTGAAVNGNELYFIFSMTKVITCAAALKLFEEGRFVMDEPLSMYLPEFETMYISSSEEDSLISQAAEAGAERRTATASARARLKKAENPILIKHLFNMTAGFSYDTDMPEFKQSVDAGKKTTRDLVRVIASKPLSFEPGSQFQYSFCHDVIAALIEVISGKSFGEYLYENIFAPLEIEDAFFHIDNRNKNFDRMATLYRFNDERTQISELPLENMFGLGSDIYESGGAGLIMSAHDYSVFADALANGGVGRNGARILRQNTVSLMRENTLRGDVLQGFRGGNSLRLGYGYGLGVRTLMSRSDNGVLSTVGEFGWGGAAGAYVAMDMENKLSITFFQSLMNSHAIYIQPRIRNLVYSAF